MGRVSHCTRCGAQLPWLGVEYGIVKNTPPRYPSRFALWYERTLESWGLLPSRTLTCRYCDAAIAEDTQICTNCGRSLVAHKRHL